MELTEREIDILRKLIPALTTADQVCLVDDLVREADSGSQSSLMPLLLDQKLQDIREEAETRARGGYGGFFGG